jgi:hypothetical protein
MSIDRRTALTILAALGAAAALPHAHAADPWPTRMTQAGVPGFDVQSRQAIHAPAGTPEELCALMKKEIPRRAVLVQKPGVKP